MPLSIIIWLILPVNTFRYFIHSVKLCRSTTDFHERRGLDMNKTQKQVLTQAAIYSGDYAKGGDTE